MRMKKLAIVVFMRMKQLINCDSFVHAHEKNINCDSVVHAHETNYRN